MHDDDAYTLSSEQEARRHLLKLASYVPPAILGAMVLGPRMALADAGETLHCDGGTVIMVSAAGQACCPCVPSSNQYNPDVCNQERCKLGNCSACRLLVFHNESQCRKTTANCGACSCVAVQVAGEKKPFWMCR